MAHLPAAKILEIAVEVGRGVIALSFVSGIGENPGLFFEEALIGWVVGLKVVLKIVMEPGELLGFDGVAIDSCECFEGSKPRKRVRREKLAQIYVHWVERA
jgi:hypothetical protein